MSDMMNIGGEIPPTDSKVNLWTWDSGFQSGANTAAPSIGGGTENDFLNKSSIVDWNRDYTIEEATRQFICQYLIIFDVF